MKKLLTSLLAVALIAGATVAPAKAAGTITTEEQKIITKLNDNNVPSEYVQQAKNYLQQNDVTAEQVAKINAQIDVVAQMCKDEGITTIDQLKNASSTFKNKFVSAVQVAADVIEIKISVSADGKVVARDAQGNIVGESKGNTNQTGFGVDSAVATLAGLVAVVAVCGAVASKKKLFA